MLPNPWMLLAAVVASLGLAVGGFSFGVKYQRGQDARTQQLITEAKREAQLGAAAAIAKIEIKNTTIRQQLETVTREVPVYSECRNTDDAMRMLNNQLAGEDAKSSGGGELSKADTVDR